MKRVKIFGEAVVKFTHYIDVPDDELQELLDDRENLITNMDEEEATKEIIEWAFIRGFVQK